MHVEPGTTDVSISIYCRDSDGAELTGKVAANFALTYHRPGAAPVAISLSNLLALTTAHTDGGIKEIGNAEYRLDLPDAACAAGATQVTIQGTVAGGYVLGYPIDLSTLAGTGPYACTWTINDGTTALEGAVVSFFLAGVLRGRGTTNASGQVPMSLPAGTFTVSITLAGYTFANTTHVVSATASTWTKTFSMTAVAWPASTTPDTTTVRWRVRKTSRAYAGADECTVYMGISQGPGVAGQIYNGDNLDFDSDATDADGYVYFANTPKGATVAVKTATNGAVQYVKIPSDCGDTFEGLELIGSG